VFSLLLLLGAAPSGAADRAPSPPKEAGAPPSEGAPGSASYRIGVGDVLNIEVVGRRDLSAQYTVAQDGVLFMPLTGGVPAEGKTAIELSAELARRLSLYDRDITQVNVSIAEFRSRRINVLGAVLHPGKFSFAELPNVWDAIGEAGGPTEDANLSAVEIVPSDQTGGQTPQVVDVAAAVREGRVRNMDRLKPGDTVRVPRALPGTLPSPGLTSGTSSSIFLFGAINRPGPIPADRQTDLMSAISQSGGPTPDANLSAVQIVRRTGTRAVHMKVNLSNYIDKAMVSGNPPLMAGDTVFLPRQGTKGFLAVVRTLSPILALASTVILIFRR
jgi:polysaccharide export outer membrane protein